MGRRRSELRWWFSGRILACHAGDRGSIPRQRKNNVSANPIFHPVCVVVVRIWRFHRHGPGSIPGMGIFLSTFKIL